MLSDKQLSEIREREQKATVGPWNRWPLRPTEMVGVDATDCRVYMAKFNKECLKATHNRQVRDADFIAHSRTDIPLLLDEVSELRKIARELATELAYVHESPTFEMCKSATGSELLSRPSIQQLTSEAKEK